MASKNNNNKEQQHKKKIYKKKKKKEEEEKLGRENREKREETKLQKRKILEVNKYALGWVRPRKRKSKYPVSNISRDEWENRSAERTVRRAVAAESTLKGSRTAISHVPATVCYVVDSQTSPPFLSPTKSGRLSGSCRCCGETSQGWDVNSNSKTLIPKKIALVPLGPVYQPVLATLRTTRNRKQDKPEAGFWSVCQRQGMAILLTAGVFFPN